MTIFNDSNFAAHLDAIGTRPVRHLDRLLCAVNLSEFMSADGYVAFMRLNMLRLRLLAGAYQAQAMIGCLQEGPPTRQNRPDLARSVEELGHGVARCVEHLHEPISLSVAYRKRLVEYSLRVNCVLTQDIPSLTMRRDIAARVFYASRSDAVLSFRRKALEALLGNEAVRPLTDSANRHAIAMTTEPEGTHAADDAVRMVSEAYLRTRGELALDEVVKHSIVQELLIRYSCLRFRQGVVTLWGVRTGSRSLIEANKALEQVNIDIGRAMAFSRTNPGLAHDLMLGAAEGLVRAAGLLRRTTVGRER